MAGQLRKAGIQMRVMLGLAGVLLVCMPASARHRKSSDAVPTDKPFITASQPAVLSIPVGPLGFAPPGEFYQGLRESLVSLDFLDDNRLLFTFRAPGLLRRSAPGQEKPHQVRALVLRLPQGTVDSEAVWTIHGGGRYLWALDGARYLMRDGDQLKQGDSTLELKPLLRFPGSIEWVEMDPAQQLLVTDSRESAAAGAGQVGSPATAEATVEANEPRRDDAPDMVLRILRRTTGEVMLVSRVRTIVHLPISGEGYLEALRSSAREWVLNLNYFTGGSRMLGRVTSACSPPLVFLRRDVALANTCLPQGGRSLVAVDADGKRLWEAPAPATQVWPVLVPGAGGGRVARETLVVSHPVDVFTPLSFEDVTGQMVEVFDTATGRLLLRAPASPVLDGGGNVALSPSGRRAAVLSGGAIQVYDLDAAAATAR